MNRMLIAMGCAVGGIALLGAAAGAILEFHETKSCDSMSAAIVLLIGAGLFFYKSHQIY